MKFFQSQSLGQEILNLLGAERVILLSGRLEKLRDISAQKEKLIAQLAARPEQTNVGRITEIRAAAEENAQLYAAAKRGLRSVLDRFDGVGTKGIAFETYNPSGQKTGRQSALHERKA